MGTEDFVKIIHVFGFNMFILCPGTKVHMTIYTEFEFEAQFVKTGFTVLVLIKTIFKTTLPINRLKVIVDYGQHVSPTSLCLHGTDISKVLHYEH